MQIELCGMKVEYDGHYRSKIGRLADEFLGHHGDSFFSMQDLEMLEFRISDSDESRLLEFCMVKFVFPLLSSETQNMIICVLKARNVLTELFEWEEQRVADSGENARLEQGYCDALAVLKKALDGVALTEDQKEFILLDLGMQPINSN